MVDDNKADTALASCLQVQGKEGAVRTAFIQVDTEGVGYLTGEQIEAALAQAGEWYELKMPS